MAFMFEEDRGLTKIKDPYPHLGPGTYNSDNQHQQMHGYAPFMSTGDRVVPLVAKTKNTEPGPGMYEISKPMGDSGVQAYMNKSTIIVKVQSNGTSAFRSNQDRFKEGRRGKANSPGPGAYDWQPQNGRGFVPNEPSKVIEDIRNMNNQRKVQSIPQQRPSGGHKFQDIEQLANHQLQVQQQPQQVARIGPGSYDVVPSLGAQNKATAWDKSKSRRFDEQQVNSLGPGKYNITKRVVPRFKRNASPGFISETVRSHFDQMIYNTNSELKAELRKRTGYKDSEVPGPGHYTSNVYAMRIGQKAREFQFFGSSLERFKMGDQSNLGPGQYQLNNSFDALHKKKNYVNYSFLSTKAKDEQHAEEPKPGPGAYNIHEHTLKQQIIKKFTLGYKGSFGSTEKRFDEKNSSMEVGPGKYELVSAPEGVATHAVTSAFKSGTKRLSSETTRKDQPSIGQYDIGQFNIATKMNKQANFLQNLKRIDVVKPGFDSAQPRFKDSSSTANESTQQTSSIQQPSKQYDSSYLSDQKSYDPKSIKAPFVSRSKRMDYLGASQSPGVGQYQVDNAVWKKPSFNTHYNRILEDDQ